MDQRINLNNAGAPSSPRSNKHEAIIGSAAALFLSKGYEATTIADIARSAGVAVGSIYRYVADKRALLDEVRTQLAGEIATVMKAAMNSSGDERTRLAAMVDAAFVETRRKPDTLRFLFLAPQHLSDALPDGSPADPMAAVLEAALAERVRAGRIHASVARSVARLGHGMVLAGLMHGEPDALKAGLANLFAAAS